MMSKAQEKHIPDTSVEQDVMRDAIYALTAYCVHQSMPQKQREKKNGGVPNTQHLKVSSSTYATLPQKT